jgi:hypothetical protein
MVDCQGCQIFLRTAEPKRGKCTKIATKILMAIQSTKRTKIYQMVMKHTKILHTKASR